MFLSIAVVEHAINILQLLVLNIEVALDPCRDAMQPNGRSRADRLATKAVDSGDDRHMGMHILGRGQEGLLLAETAEGCELQPFHTGLIELDFVAEAAGGENFRRHRGAGHVVLAAKITRQPILNVLALLRFRSVRDAIGGLCFDLHLLIAIDVVIIQQLCVIRD